MSNETCAVDVTPAVELNSTVEPVVAVVAVVEPVVAVVVAKVKRPRKAKAVEPVAVVVEPVVVVAKVKRPRKAKVVKVGRGRPTVFVGDLLKGIVRLLKKHKNATLVREILGASGKGQRDLIALRQASGLTEKCLISMPTLLSIKATHGIVGLSKGRPAIKAA